MAPWLTHLTPVALATAALLLDRLLGEPRRFHPLVGFGRCADWMENRLRKGAPGHPLGNRLRGLAAWLIVLLPPVLLALECTQHAYGWIADIALLYFALGARSLNDHAKAIADALKSGNLAKARELTGRIVSRDTSVLDEEGVCRATVESVLENGNDAIFGALFWFFIAGGTGALLFRLANTLDAMWGYRDARRLYFGWAAARIDDILNFVPARLTALSYALAGRTAQAIQCWRIQARRWSSPNAGPVMAAGAGALNVRLGGAARYHGALEQRPELGQGASPSASSIDDALAMVSRGIVFWLLAATTAMSAWLLSGTGQMAP